MTTRKEDYSKWFLDIVLEANLIDYGVVKGTMIMKPYGYAIWDNIKAVLDTMIKDTGHQNVYFPMLIPKSFFQKEADHVEGFAPEFFQIDRAYGGVLDDPLVLRPTSETIIWNSFKNWIKSHRDLPILINQWANIFRMELKTKPFLRTSEFLWQEGHTAHKSQEEAESETVKMLNVYKDLFENYLAVPVFAGRKSENEKFAGAVNTYAIETMVQDGKALQCGTSHYLGQNFAKAFDVQYQDEGNKPQYPYSTSWGASTRMIGALIMSHSDDKGLVLPPRIAPLQVVIVPIFNKNNKDVVLKKANEIFESLNGKMYAGAKLSVKLDDDAEKSPGWKFAEYELKGIPLRIEIGERDLKNNVITLTRRDKLGNTDSKEQSGKEQSGKEQLSLENLDIFTKCIQVLDDIQKNLFNIAKNRMDTNITDLRNSTWQEFKKFFSKDENSKDENSKDESSKENSTGFVIAGFCQDSESKAVEKKIKEETKATIRIVVSEKAEDLQGIKCIYSGKQANMLVYFAKSY